MHRRSTVILGAALAAAIGLALATVSPGRAAARAAERRPGVRATEQVPFKGIPADVRTRMLAQQPLTRAASQIRWAVERGDASGFAGIALQAHTVAVWWKGTPPAAIGQAIADAGRSVPVRLHPARYSLAELRAASDRVVAAMRANPAGPLHTVEIPVDGSGLVLGSDRGDATAAAAPYLSTVRVPVKTVSRPHIRLLDGSRGADMAPHMGGASIVNVGTGTRCSSGFGVTVNSARYLLTAQHCGQLDDGWYNGNGSQFIGTAVRQNIDHDLVLISTDARGRIWDGGVGSDAFPKRVHSWDWVFPGEWVCQSGAASGVACNIQNSNNFTATWCGYDSRQVYRCRTDLIMAQKADLSTVAVPGDSGGPVFTLTTQSQDLVVAKGIITAGDGPTLFYQDFGTAWRDFGIGVVSEG